MWYTLKTIMCMIVVLIASYAEMQKKREFVSSTAFLVAFPQKILFSFRNTFVADIQPLNR